MNALNRKISLDFAKLLRRLPFKSFAYRFNKRRHRKLNSSLKPLFEQALAECDCVDKEMRDNQVIWVCWWQGKDKMPILVKKCYQSIKENRGKRSVVLITKYNYRQYSNIEDYIIQKFKAGKISITHFSDILRMNILKINGGLWVDATILVTNSLDIFDTSQVFSRGGLDDDYFFVARGRWTSFLIGGPSNLQIFSFMDKFFSIYWESNDILLDYFLVDYALNFAWDHNLSDFKVRASSLGNIAPNIFKLQPILNDKFDPIQWKKLNKNTNVFKLSYKKKLKDKKDTYYRRIKNNEFE